MSTCRENFEKWYVQVLESLYGNEHAGFAILMITFPLLERYLREKAGLCKDSIGDYKRFASSFFAIFPLDGNPDTVQRFWTAYRHGLLHRAALSTRPVKNKPPPTEIKLRGDVPDISYDAQKDAFIVNPSGFSRRVIAVIKNDFPSFESTNTPDHSLPIIEDYAGGTVSPHSIGAESFSPNTPYNDI